LRRIPTSRTSLSSGHLRAAGFQREGLTRGAQWRDGAYRDGYLYAITRQDVHTS
jgi:RimJ/RimL family protein N-acetyltransferase